MLTENRLYLNLSVSYYNVLHWINIVLFQILTIIMALTCRFYEQRYPEIDDVVMVNVRSIADMGAYVHLLEYNNIEGMILLSELSRRRIR